MPTLLILAAGIGSRYGGLKQVDGMGPNQQAIIDYSVFDALRAGFKKVVFVIRKDIEQAFREKVGDRISKHIEVAYVFQEMHTALDWLDKKPERTKPWGTAHAMLAAKSELNTPFAVINADDFYGRDAFVTIAEFLNTQCSPKEAAMVGYLIQNTLSENGTVSRGVCATDAHQYLTTVTERTKIERRGNGIFFTDDAGKNHRILKNTPVSMNFWGFHPSILDTTEAMFRDFVSANGQNPKSEFYIPTVVNAEIQSGALKLKVLTSESVWYGVTYPEDKAEVQASLLAMTENGQYPAMLWA